MKNIPKTCFTCSESIYVNPEVRRPEDPNKLQPLDEAFTGESPPKPHICNQSNQNQSQSRNDYQDRNKYEQQQQKEKERTTTGEGQLATNVKVLARLDMIENKLVTIQELLEALLKSNGIFQKASQVT